MQSARRPHCSVTCLSRAFVTLALVGLVLLPAVLAGCGSSDPVERSERIATTTTSLKDSGLVDDVVLPLFARTAPGVTVKVLAVGSGEALAMGAGGEDVVLFAGPPAERSTSLRNVLPGMVKSVSPSGRLLHVVVAAESVEIAALVTRAAAEGLDLEVGGYMVAAFKASAVHPIARHERRLS